MVLHIAIIKQNAAMVDWLLSDEHDVAYREKQLTSAARGNFFKVFVLFAFINNIQTTYDCLEVDPVTTVKPH